METKTLKDVEFVKRKILSNHLLGKCMDDVCTDGYDTEITLLCLEIVNHFKEVQE